MESDLVYLRALELEDLDRTHKWHNNPVLYETLTDPFRYVSRAAEEDWLRKRISYSTQDISLAICLTENHQHIGNFYFREIDWISRHAQMGIFIGEPVDRSKGYGSTALNLAIDHAFGGLGLRKLYAPIFADNKPSIRLVEKWGAVEEGRFRNHSYKNGTFKDIVIMVVYNNKFS